LKRFVGSRNEELADGTLSGVEGTKEFRIVRDDVQGFPFRIMTRGLLNELQDYQLQKP
jgi:hypothetical protein